MPNHDHKGPRGEGAMTGRKQGDCNRHNQREDAPRLGLNRREEGGRGRHHDGRGQRHHDHDHNCDHSHHHHNHNHE